MNNQSHQIHFQVSVNVFIKQSKHIQNSNPRFRLLSDDLMTGFVQTAVVDEEDGGGWRGAALRPVIHNNNNNNN